MIKVVNFVTPEQQIYELSRVNNIHRGTLTEIHLADIHFGAMDPAYQYNILKEQFIDKISSIHFDVLSIDGDLFDHKFMSNSDVIMYATMFMDLCVNVCRIKKAVLVIIAGTKSHDDDQLKLFYHYLNDSTVDIRIVEEVKFEYIKGAKVLCIPELYNMGADYYNQFLLYSGDYDTVFMHGTLKGAVYQAPGEEAGIRSDKAPIFSIEDFCLSRGPIIAGHVHPGGCFNTYFYYCGSPLRWKFGEEGEKGFLIVLHNLDTHWHYVHLEPIKSYRYDTINLDYMLMCDPKDVINYVTDLKDKHGIDYIRLEFTKEPSDIEQSNLDILKSYYKTNGKVKIKAEEYKKKGIIDSVTEILDKYKGYEYILDKSLSDYDKLVRYINQQKGYEYITVDELVSILEEEI